LTFEIQILGSNSALAAHGRHPSAQLLRYGSRQILIDCGEGTQMRLQRFKAKPFKIDHIFISHLHGDHYFGLIGLLTSYHLLQRKTALTIFGPPQLQAILQLQLDAANTQLSYPLVFKATQANAPELLLDDESLSVTSFPLAHRIPCTGFIFREKKHPRKIVPDAVSGLHLTAEMYDALRQGKDVVDSNGGFHANESLTESTVACRSYAYCSDTLYKPDIIPLISGLDLLYHEATFSKDCEERAKQTFHSTTSEAAQIAAAAKVKQLLIGHFSSKYLDLQPLLIEAAEVFTNTRLAIEGDTISIGSNALETSVH
jgi:ribonuclease Z